MAVLLISFSRTLCKNADVSQVERRAASSLEDTFSGESSSVSPVDLQEIIVLVRNYKKAISALSLWYSLQLGGGSTSRSQTIKILPRNTFQWARELKPPPCGTVHSSIGID